MNLNWDLRPIYPDEAAFEKDLNTFKDVFVPKIATFQGKLAQEDSFIEYLHTDHEVSALLERLYLYASCDSSLDKRDVKRSERLARVSSAYENYAANASYIDPEILALGQTKVNEFLSRHPEEKAEYDFSFDKLFREQKHIRSAAEEKLLSAYNGLSGEGSELYSALSVADYQPKKTTLSNGKEVEVNLSNWTHLIPEVPTAEDRQKVFECLYSWFDEHKNVYGEIYNTVLRAEVAEMKNRGYESILEEHLYGNNIPLTVFHHLIEVASTENAALKKYYELRRKALGLSKHRSYDRFLQLAKSNKKYSYEEAKELFFASIKNFPTDYQEKAREVTKDGYVDVLPHAGKRSGAFSTGGANIHPYILLNFEGTLEDVFTLAHESGHSIHTLYAEENQPINKQNYSIFVAEIASTFNEHNLLDYLLKRDDLSREDKIALLQKAIDEIVATFYRQTLFAHYEYDIALKAERDEPINYQVLSQEMVKLYQQYYGIDITEEHVKELVWAYIPHLFYTPFYVYQYATSFTASMLLYQRVKEGQKNAFENHISLLKMGGSDYPVEEVKKAGVDFTKKETFYACPRRMEELVNELEVLLNEKN